MLVEFLDHHCMLANREKTDKFENPIVSEYDFLYLPIDFRYLSKLTYIQLPS